MKKFYLLLVCLVLGTSYLIAQNKSNKGKEFWVGWGHNILPAGTSPGPTSKLAIYISAEQTANISISIPGTAFTTITDVINAGQVKTYQITLLSIMLTTEGVLSNRAIHIESDVDVVAYCHQYGQNSAGATMLMPVETYGYTYYSLNYTQISNSLATGTAGNACYSWCYVVASEDNTKLQVTPAVTTQGNRPANTPYTITLNKGQIYNFFGKYNGPSGSTYVGEDLTGSKIVSVADDVTGACHPIAVFSGSSRILINATNGGDMLQQQIFPASAWGTRYLTVPSSSASSIATYNNNVYRVAVRNPNTVVKRNGIQLTGLMNNFYYEFQSNQPEYIEADGPVLVAQYFPSSYASGYLPANGPGDPEMVYLSPLEQSIKKAYFYNTTQESISKNYISVVIPYTGLASLFIDGAQTFDYVGFHPNNFNYRIVLKELSGNTQHSIQCDSGFIATTYGLGSAESYAFNAGTLINNLNNIGGVLNTYGGGFSATTCPGTPFKFSMQAAYKPSLMVWKLSQVTGLLPVNADTTVTNPIPNDSSIINGRKYYTYSLPREYYVPSTGTYNLPVTCTAAEIDNCNNTETITTSITVNPGPKGYFTSSYSGCITDTAYLSGVNLPSSYNIVKYRWFFDDNTQDSTINAKKKFNAQGTHPTKFRVIADNGCVGDSTMNVVTAQSPLATFGMNPSQACGSATVNFTDTSSFPNGAPLTQWYWDFGNGNTVLANSNAPQTQTYSTPGNYIIKHTAGVGGGCGSDTAYKTLHIYANPVANFTYNTGCLQDSTLNLTDASTVADAQALTWSWDFGEPSSGANNTSTLQNPTHRYHSYNTFPITLTVTTANGCTHTITKNYTVTGFSSAIAYDVANETTLCSNKQVKLTNQINIAQDSVYRIDIYWDFIGQPSAVQTDNTPTQNEVYTHLYPTFTTATPVTYTIKWIVYSKGGCVSEKLKTITLYPMPTLAYATLIGKCINTDPISIANATVTNSLSGNGVYSGNGMDAAGLFTPATAGVGQHTIKYIYTTTGGCIDSVQSSIRVFPKPVAGFDLVQNICFKDSILLKDTSNIATGTIATRNWDFGDASTAIRTNAAQFYHPYAAYGSYPIKLYVVSDSACVSDTAKQTVAVHPLPQVAFTIPSGVCLPSGEAAFTNQSTIVNGNGSQLSYVWDFGDGSATSSTPEPTHNYAAAGSYNVFLTATSILGCKDTLTKNLSTFYQKPVAAFSIVGDTLCPNYDLQFNDASTAPSSTVSSWQWIMGDGDTLTTQSPVHAYTTPGDYTVQLVVKNPDGCTSIPAIKTFRIYKQPVVDAGPNRLVPANTPVLLLATSNDTIFHYLWTPSIYLDDDTLLRPISTPMFNTTYTIMAYGAGGNCVAYDTVKVTALQTLKVANAFSPNGDGINDTWEIPYLNDYPQATVEIFNRYGQLVFTAVNYIKNWDGKVNGKPLPPGTYYYIIVPKSNGYNKLSGSVTIIK